MNSIPETLTGNRKIVNRVTYHTPDTGWSVLRVEPFNFPQQQETTDGLQYPTYCLIPKLLAP
jgi:exodeoxyribonuclease V alpha subunit